ncbi:Rac2g, Rho family GTPase [Monocercomonoides exilis]|uniref:Rac2g, Rho family GTPase n=1 Tax=Monocercomonoides exilis TaxID=2049356 RepID=UPI00355AA4EC|nr:Rac2g, Rho family GTPase [Monocercomonoides exilis]|eukprot:MONOS_10254.1-p1 / transcript=MONOS_10254.1 / gene=MONOS_10254 / organism=Monocercomonoides_exilis_PA203 / gene_product=Rac2g, Rho family GTPase / transcript_product=Rac2g, Rho family GTPase / location=Mono_scaffold00458:48215-49064(+) / protein_length=192 / sequence_SO=supercontig / SO=protein_coding / is_pseudo=false
MSMTISMKTVVIGDGAVGKSCMLLSYAKNIFPPEYVMTIFDNEEVLLVVDEKTVHMMLWDTAGQEEYDRLRALAFPGTDVFMICFSLCDSNSLKNVKDKWLPEIKEFIQDTPVVLVGTKMDIRDENIGTSLDYVTTEAGQQFAKQNGLSAYVECSAKTQDNLSNVFETVAREYFKAHEVHHKKEKACCSIL